MQEFKRGARRSSRVRHAARLRFAASLLLIFSFTSGAARAQTGTPPVGGQDQRGIGLKPDAQQKPATPEEAKARGARPELVLQTGYAIIGASGMRFSPDGRLLATYSMSGGQVKLWDVSTGRELRTLAAGAGGAYFGLGGVRSVAFSCDGRLFAAGSTDGSTKVWDTATGRELHKLGGDDRGTGFDAVDAIAFGPDDRTLVALGGASAGGGESAKFWDLTTGQLASEMEGVVPAGGAIYGWGGPTVTPDGSQVLLISRGVGKPELSIKFVEIATGREARSVEVPHWDVRTSAIGSLALTPDGRLLSADWEIVKGTLGARHIKLHDLTAQKEHQLFDLSEGKYASMTFSPDGRLLASTSYEGSTALWDVKTGERLATLISTGDGGDWLVVTPDGLFDGSPSAWNQILWRFSENTFDVAPVETFFNEFFYPGLLSDIASGKRPKAPRDISLIDRRQPAVALSAGAGTAAPVSSRTVGVSIQVKDAPAGAKDVRLFRNGSLVRVWRGDVLQGRPAATLEATIPVVAGENCLTAYAFNRDNVKSADAELTVTGADSLKRAGTAYVLAVGVNQYENAKYNLRYAAADAQDFAEEVRRQQAPLGKYERVEVVPLLDADATKANILAALRLLAGADASPPAGSPKSLAGLKPAQPEDAVVVYFAGHGTAHGNHFYLIPHDLGYAGSRDALDASGLQAILSHSVSDEELQSAFEGLDAGQLLMVIDACNSGQALEAEEKRRGPMNSKGLAQLAYEKGMYVLTAAQSFQAALEAAQLGHGLLTYALVEEGLKAMAADEEPKDGVLQAREWLDYATERVPQMQLEKMRQARALNLNISFAEGDEAAADPEKRSVQRPRAFYRRELESNPLVLARKQ